jgi:hypothetical protein
MSTQKTQSAPLFSVESMKNVLADLEKVSFNKSMDSTIIGDAMRSLQREIAANRPISGVQ